MEAAYGKPTYAAAKAALDALKPGLKLMNQSALGSLEEGFEETLTLHRLGLMPMLKDSFRTTNGIENVNRLLAQLTHNVRRWTNSSQRQPLGSHGAARYRTTSAQGQRLSPSADAPASDTGRARYQTARHDGLTHSLEPVLCFN